MLLMATLLAFLSKVLDVAAVLALTPRIGEEEALAMYHGWLSLLTFAAALAGLLWACRRWGLPPLAGMPARKAGAMGEHPARRTVGQYQVSVYEHPLPRMPALGENRDWVPGLALGA